MNKSQGCHHLLSGFPGKRFAAFVKNTKSSQVHDKIDARDPPISDYFPGLYSEFKQTYKIRCDISNEQKLSFAIMKRQNTFTVNRFELPKRKFEIFRQTYIQSTV